jgi:hypothetical protein
MKTITEKTSNRNTRAFFQINVTHLIRGEEFGCLTPRTIQCEQKSKGEEKANRNTRPLGFR